MAVSTVKNATHFGFAAFYAQEALKHDLIGLAFTSSSLLVAPFGGYKGYGLDFIVYLLTAVLGGSAIGRNENGVFEDAGKIGYNFAAIDISKFADAESFKQTVDFAVRRIRSSKKAAGSERIYVPGEIEAELYEKARTDGLVLYDGVAGEISRTLGELGITESLDSVKK